MTMPMILRSFLLCLLPLTGWCTAQYPENILIDGKEEAMMATPLEDYWNKSRPKPDRLGAFSSACWRGYIGSWQIKDDHLVLLKLERKEMVEKDGSYEQQTLPISMPEILSVKSEGPLAADWFSGVLRIARGKELEYVHMGFGSVYEEDLFLYVDRGKIIRRILVKNDPSKLTSPSDASWREMGNMTNSGGVKVMTPDEATRDEQGDWLSFREILTEYQRLVESKKRIRVRGIFFPGRLWFPPQHGMDASFNLDTGNLKQLPRSGSATELFGVLTDKDNEPLIVVSEIKELPAGAPIQRRLPPAQ